MCLKKSKMEFISPEGLRIDGRRVNELRKIRAQVGVFAEADGSAYIEMGNTKALAVVYGPREVRESQPSLCKVEKSEPVFFGLFCQVRMKSKILHDRALINCEFSTATFSTGERKKKSKTDK